MKFFSTELWTLLVLSTSLSLFTSVVAEKEKGRNDEMMLKELKTISKELSSLKVITKEVSSLSQNVQEIKTIMYTESTSQEDRSGHIKYLKRKIASKISQNERRKKDEMKMKKEHKPGFNMKARRLFTNKNRGKSEKGDIKLPPNFLEYSPERHITFTLEQKMKTYRLNDFGLLIHEKLPLLLTMNNCHGINVTFTSSLTYPDEKYMSMLVGLDGVTEVYDCVSAPSEACRTKPVKGIKRRIWNCKDSTDIWLKWTNIGYVSVGTGLTPGHYSIIEYQGEKKSIPVNYIGISLLKDTNVKVSTNIGGHPCIDPVSGIFKRVLDAKEVKFTLNSKQTTYLLNDFGLPINENLNLLLHITNCHGLTITFKEDHMGKGRYAQVGLGRKKVFGCIKASSNSCNYVPVKTTKRNIWRVKFPTDLWLKWKNIGFISVGIGLTPGRDTVIEFNGPRIPVNFIGIHPMNKNVRVSAKTVCRDK